MHFYPHNIGDFNNATRHLSRIERSIYRDLIDLYYDTEAPLILDLPALCRKILARTSEEVTAVEQTLNEFFQKTEAGWVHERCQTELEKYWATNKQKSDAGKRSAQVRAEKSQQALSECATPVEQTSNKRATKQEIRNKKQETNKTINTLAPSGVSNSVFQDFVQLRKGLRAPVTDTAIQGLQREATKAHLSLEEVMVLCCQNGWRGFKAEWMEKKKTAGDKNRDVLSGLTRGLMGTGHANLLTN